jgi:seryl-tRNA synthetase
MLNPRSLAERRDEIEDSCRKRRIEVDLEALVTARQQLTELTTAFNQKNQERNQHQKAAKRKMEPSEREAHAATGRQLKEQVAELEGHLRKLQEAFDEQMLELPNFIHPEVPEGGEDDYQQLRTWGQIPGFDFEPRDHLALCEKCDLVDFEHGAKVAGQKFYYLKNEAVLLDIALQRFALDVVMDAGFVPHATPDLARPDVVSGMGFNPRGEETQIYSIANADLCLVGTAEITLGGLYADTILDEEQLPIRLAGLSHCFRTEAGSYGRESRGLYRVHQFTKVEMFAFTRPEDSEAMHGEILDLEEHIFQALELPYQVIDVASGDLGAPAYRKYDIEAWMPGRGEGGGWGEVTSASNCTDFQARRIKTRFRRKGAKKPEMVHTLNGTAIANTRTILALLEIHQRADGSVAIPGALKPYMMGREVIEPRR